LRERRALAALGVSMLAIAAIYLAVRPSSEPPPLPDDPIALARHLRAHPADWRAASALTEHALDAPVANRFALWHAAHDVAQTLAPHRDAPRMELVRAAFFHWQELSPADRRAALDTIAPLLRDHGTFYRMARPLFELTGDLAMLRRWNPGSGDALVFLRNLAAMNGRFNDYRELRGELTRKRLADFRTEIPRLSAAEIIGALPEPPYSTDEEPLLRDALATLHLRPLTEDPHQPAKLDALADYALRHDLEPLDGINAVVHKPGAAATWQQLENGSVKGRSWIDREMSARSSLTLQRSRSDEVPPFVEIYVDDARAGEGEVAASRTFGIAAAPGVHRLEVRIANPVTRNGESRLVRVVSVVP
jgi:hypothetical protein